MNGDNILVAYSIGVIMSALIIIYVYLQIRKKK